MKSRGYLLVLAVASLVGCSSPEDESDGDAAAGDFRAELLTMEQGTYWAIDEAYADGTYLLYDETDEEAEFEMTVFSFQKAGDTLHVYATPWNRNGCVKKMYSGKLEPQGKDAYLLNPVDGFGYALFIKSVPVPDGTLYRMEFRTADAASDSPLAVYLYLKVKRASQICES